MNNDSRLTAVLTGAAGQDGSHMLELLLSKGYKVIGLARHHASVKEYTNIKHLLVNKNFKLIEGDITDLTLISRILHDYKPHEFYNFAALSNVGQSFKEPVVTFEVNAKAVIGQLELIRQISPYTRYYNSATSELFGGISCPETGYTEESPFHPRSPYGVAKLAAYWATVNYREAYGLFACSGILHNHCGPRRGFEFATRKITRGVAKIKLGLETKLRMGNLEAFRDEGSSPDFCRAMWMMLQNDKPTDYLVATGAGATIREMLEHVCSIAELDINDVYEMDEQYMRPSEVPFLLGNPSKIKKELGWEASVSWKDLLSDMYENDLEDLRRH